MFSADTNRITTDIISHTLFQQKKIRVSVLRLDKIHPIISGNKWFKLKHYLEEAVQTGKKRIVTFGGAYSNHILATAAACKYKGLSCKGIIRGEKPVILSPTLAEAIQYGMDLQYTDRKTYRNEKKSYVSESDYVIHEGGYGLPGAKGAAEILNFCDKEKFSTIYCAIGTATMMAGLVKAVNNSQQVCGISVMKNNLSLEEDLLLLLDDKEKNKSFNIQHEYHFGGYAKYNDRLITFMNQFFDQTGILLDFVYTGKLFYALFDHIKNDYFSPGTEVLIIHCGGLQGNRSLPPGTLHY